MIIRRDLGRAAARYAAQGIPVLPCVPMGKRPLIKGWPERATTHLDQVRAWWTSWPEANIGLLTGAPGYDVLDVDVRADGDGFAALESLRGAGFLDAAVATAATPSSGEHYYFVGTEQAKSKLAGRYLDFQARGGYVLAPPSRVLIDGQVRPYQWTQLPRPGGTLDWSKAAQHLSGPRPFPTSLSSGGRRHHQRPWRFADLSKSVRTAPEGERNKRLFFAANRYVEAGRDPWLLMEDARSAGLPHAEITATIRSAVITSRKVGHRGL